MKTHRDLSNLTEAYVYATEVNLETLCDLAFDESASALRLQRQRAICTSMLHWCASVLINPEAVDWGPSHDRSYPYVSEALVGPSIESALDALVQRWRRPRQSARAGAQRSLS
jgi:hypothetical protein